MVEERGKSKKENEKRNVDERRRRGRTVTRLRKSRKTSSAPLE